MKRSDSVQFQLKAAERRELLELGKIEIEDPPDTRDFVRRVQLAACSPKKPPPDQG